MFLEVRLKRDGEVGKVEKPAEYLKSGQISQPWHQFPASRQPSLPPQPHNPIRGPEISSLGKARHRGPWLGEG